MSPRLSNAQLNEAARSWSGAHRPYDLIKELVVATLAITVLALGLTIVFSSPDERPSTVATWARGMPIDFLTTAVAELNGTSATAGYGPPYNHNSSGQHLAFIRLQKWLGVNHPVDTARDFVIAPLDAIPNRPALRRSIDSYKAAPAKQQMAWTDAFTKAVGNAKAGADGTVTLPAGDYGPVAPMLTSLLEFAQSGGLDGQLLTSRQFFQTDYTKPLLLLNDGSELAARAKADHLLGTQWGMMNETGSYPGQVWLWLYTFWYQIKPFSTSHNADALVWAVMAVLSLGLILVPFLPGVRDIPRAVPIYRLIWRDHYRQIGPRAP